MLVFGIFRNYLHQKCLLYVCLGCAVLGNKRKYEWWWLFTRGLYGWQYMLIRIYIVLILFW